MISRMCASYLRKFNNLKRKFCQGNRSKLDRGNCQNEKFMRQSEATAKQGSTPVKNPPQKNKVWSNIQFIAPICPLHGQIPMHLNDWSVDNFVNQLANETIANKSTLVAVCPSPPLMTSMSCLMLPKDESR